jgi:hypothetical protein
LLSEPREFALPLEYLSPQSAKFKSNVSVSARHSRTVLTVFK